MGFFIFREIMILQNDKINRFIRGLAIFLFLTLLGLTAVSPVAAAYTVTPSTWNIIGLDSNTPAFGPYRFPIGAKVCGGSSGSSDTALFTWDTGGTDNGTYIYLRPGSANPVNITFGADGCADAYFEVEVNKASSAFDQTRRYHITAGGVSTPTPRELYVEHLISQSRNGIDNVKLNGVSIPAGGYMNLIVGNTYTIELVGHTAPGGYNQFEEFINFPNTIFQVLSVSTDYATNTSPYVSTSGHKYLYADACKWENDPNSPYYRACWEDWKSGDTVITTYTVKILSGGGSTETLDSLLYDFSGSSFHYNADYSTGARFANIIDPTNVSISKSFSPNPTNVNGVSALTFTLTNPNAGAVSGLNFTDVFPTTPGDMVVDSTPNATTNGCGTPTFSPVAGAGSISFSNGTIAANSSCTVKVNVTTNVEGDYANTSGNLFVGSVDTGKSASASLTVNAIPPPPPPPSSCPGQEVELARWTMDPSQGPGVPPLFYSKASDVATAVASYVTVSGVNSISTAYGNPINSWGGTAPTGLYGWSETDTSMNNYFQFVLDTSKYGGVRVTFDVGLYTVGDWANPTSNIYVNTSADGGPFTVYTPYPSASKGALTAGLVALAATTGTNTTTFRFGTDGSAKKPGALFCLDNIIFTGCQKPNPPTITKSFSPNPVAVGGTSTLTFTVTNPNAGSALTGIAFNDTLPTGLTVTAGSSAQCGGTLTTTAPSTISFSGGTLAASGSCNITATVTATSAGPHDNVSGFVEATESGKNTGSTGIATASLTAVLPPSISKLFAPNPILAGGTSTLTFTITNPNQNNSLSGVAFSDTFPATMVVANPTGATTSGCGAAPTYAPVAGAGSITFSNGTIAAAGICTVTVNVTATATGDNTSGSVSHIINAATVNGNTATDTLTVSPPYPQISLLKQVSNNLAGPWSSYLAVSTGANVYYQFTVENAGDVPLSPVSVTDPIVSTASCSWPASLPFADSFDDDHIATCTVGPVTAVAGSHTNTATASGTYSGSPYTDQSSAIYATTGLTIVKSVTQTYFTAAGNTLNYSYVVTNSGSAALAGTVTVADDKSTDESCPALSTVGDLDNYLDPGESIICTATYTVVAADVTAKLITNIASATVGGVTSPTDTKTVPLAADLTATKTNNVSGQLLEGNSFDWTLTVSNAAASGSSASFADTQTLLTDNLPDSGATYIVGTVKTSGVTGTINCSITANTLTCTASGGTVNIPPALQGTVSVTNGSAAVTGSGTAFTAQVTAGSIIVINGVSYAVLSIQNDTQLTLTTTYAGATEGGLSIPGSFSVPVTVTTTAAGSLVNPKGGGTCKADPDTTIPEIDETNNTCTDTVTVLALPSITVVKTVTAYSDPINGTTDPKTIPGSFMTYTLLVTNTGSGAVDNNTTVITDPISANTELFVGDINGVGSGPVLFTNGATASGLCYDYANPGACAGDNIEFSNTLAPGPYVYGYSPTADANGCDAGVTSIKITLGGPFNGVVLPGNNPSFDVKFRVRVK